MPKPKSSKTAKIKEKLLKGKPTATKAQAPPTFSSRPAVWRPGKDALEDGEELDYDPSAYDCLHAFSLEWPSLSFDVIRDEQGGPRTVFPHTVYLAAGTQARRGAPNSLVLAKLGNIGQGRHGRRRAGKAALGQSNAEDDSEDDDDDDDEEDDELPSLHYSEIRVPAAVNRVRASPQLPHLVAAWLENSVVEIYDVSSQLGRLKGAMDAKPLQEKSRQQKALQAHSHGAEGFALDWSPCCAGLLASGDCRSRIHIWQPLPAGSWAVGKGLRGHEGSVEDIQWSPQEESVFMSASTDKTLRVWDYRVGDSPQLTVQAHEDEVNVLSWNRHQSFLVASGADDGTLRIWDLRHLANGGSNPGDSCVATFTYHKDPITAVEWSPFEASMLAVSAGDQQITLWDLALERDPEEEAALGVATNATAPEQLPPQLLFVHSGQTDMKEVHWHPQIPGLLLSTALDGFNVFKPENAAPDEAQPMQS